MNLSIKTNLNKIQKYLKIRRFFLRVPLIETNTSIYYLVKKSCKNDNRSVKISGFVKCSVEKASKTVGYIPERNLVWKAWRVQELWLSGYLKHGITKYAQAHFPHFWKFVFTISPLFRASLSIARPLKNLLVRRSWFIIALPRTT